MTRRGLRVSLFLAAIGLLNLCVSAGYADDFRISGGTTPDSPKDSNEPDNKCDPDICPLPGATNSSLKPGDKSSCAAGEPVFLLDGSFYYRHTDLAIPGRIPLVVRRAYDTRSEFKGLMGYGWSMNHHVRLGQLSNGNLLLKRGDNTKTEFVSAGNGIYTAKDGYDTLRAGSDGTYAFERGDGYTYSFDLDGCLDAIGDRNGNQLLFEYYTDPNGLKLLMPYSSISPYATVKTPITLGRDFRLARVVEAYDRKPSGRFIEFLYNDSGRIATARDFTGREVTYTYDPNQTGDLIAMGDPCGNAYHYTYDSNHLMVSFVGLGCGDCSLHTNIYNSSKKVVEQDHGSNVKQFEYLPGNRTRVTNKVYDDGTHPRQWLSTRYEYYDFDANGYTTQYTKQVGKELDAAPGSAEADDVVNRYAHDAQGNLVRKIDPRGIQIEYAYDPSTGNLLTETVHIPDSNDSVTTTYTYDPNYVGYTSRTAASTRDPQRYRTEYTYDASGNVATETRFADTNDPTTAMVTRYTYDAKGSVLTKTDPIGNVTAYQYDANGFVARTYDPANPSHQTLYVYDALGNLRSTTNALGNTTTYEYDALDRTTKITDPCGAMTVSTYDGANLVRIEEGKTLTQPGRVTIMEYDGLNRRTTVKKLDGNKEITLFAYAYDSEGRVLQTTDGNGSTARNAYDELGRPTRVTNPNGFATTYGYDQAGNVVWTTDAENNSTYYAYDYANRLTDVVDALDQWTHHAYNAIGKILSITDARDKTTTRAYDGLGRLTKIVDPMGHTTPYSYDENGNLSTKVTPNEYADPLDRHPIIYTYDSYGQLAQTHYPDGKTVTYAHDAAGNLTGWSDGSLSGSTAFDGLSRPTQVTTQYPGFSKTVSYTYDRFGRRQTMTDGEGAVTSYNYDGLGRLTTIAHPGNLMTQYSYDKAGRLTHKIVPNGVTTTYTYDVSGRLTKLVNAAAGGSVISSFAYTYDKVGNRVSMKTLQGTHKYTYDDTYQLLSAIHPDQPAEVYAYDDVGNRRASVGYGDWTYDNCNRLISYEGVTFTYDASGNTISKKDSQGLTAYAYDHEDRMVSATTPSHAAAYIYDPRGTRLGKAVDGVATYFSYDREDVIAECDSSGTLVARYHHGQGIDEPVAMTIGGTTHYYTFDGLGSVSELVDTAGSVVENYTYDAFGNKGMPAATQNPYTYTSREYCIETGVYFLGQGTMTRSQEGGSLQIPSLKMLLHGALVLP